MVSALPTPDRSRDRIAARRALISVSDKSGLLELASALSKAGVSLVSTGSTCQLIRDARIDVQEVSEVTGFPESLDGRVKTLHPSIHGGILADLRYDSHVQQLADLDGQLAAGPRLVERLAAVVSRIGEDRDLGLLEALLVERRGEFPDPRQVDAMLREVRSRRARLLRSARRRAARVLGTKAGEIRRLVATGRGK